MRIGIDCRMLGPGFGLARYVQQLVKHLMIIDRDNQYVLFVRKENEQEVGRIKTEAEIESGERMHNFETVIADIAWYSVDEQLKFKKIIRSVGVDLMHFPHWNVPLLYNDPFVVTVHDLIMHHYPRAEATTHGPLVYKLKDMAHRLVLWHALRFSKKVFVTSEFTKADVHKTLKTPLEKMVVTYQAPFEQPDEHAIIGGEDRILRKYGIEKPFVLYVGSAYPHKNLDGLLNIWEQFEKEYSSNYELIFVGKENYFYKRLAKQLAHHRSVKYAGFVPDDELNVLYDHAKLYVFPSYYEGFGLPPLEAMLHGVPVVCSNRSCMPEVLGNAALFADPDNHAQFAEMIDRGLTDDDVRVELKRAGKEQLKLYSWKRLAEETLSLYKRLG